MARNKYDIDEQLESPFDFGHLKRSFVYIKKYKKKMILALCISITAAIAGLVGPLLTQYALDKSIPNENYGQLALLAGLLLLFTGISTALGNIRSRIMTVVGQNIIFDIREDLFAHLQKLPFTYYDDRPHGKILIRVINYVNSVSDMLSNGIINFIMEILNMVFILIFMLIVDVRLTLVAVSGLPLFMALKWLME